MTAPDVLDGRYELQQPLGSGGMAAVYRAWDLRAGRACAVKVLADVLARDEAFRRRFRHEAASAGGLTHPRIVTVYGWGQDGLRQFIAMEYVDGGTLQERLKRDGPLPEAEALAIAAEVADALAYAHGRHVVHRDIKPHNILLTADGHIKVADFGIARTLDGTALTGTGTVMGSAPYLSPEQARGDAAGPASDQYALGVVLFEALAGRVPFHGEAPVAVALKHLHEAPPNLRTVRSDVSPETAALVERLLAKAPRDRYPDAGTLASELHRLAGDAAARSAGAAAGRPPVGGATAPTQPGRSSPGEGGPVRPSAGAAVADATAVLPKAPAAPPSSPESTAALPRLDHVSRTSSMAALRSAQPDAVSATAQLRLPGRRRTLVAMRIAVAAVCVAFGLTIVAAAYRAAWLAAHVGTPGLVGHTVADAGQTVQARRLGLLVMGKRQDPKAAFGVIVAQDPAPGTDVAKGTVINVIVSQGSGVVPDLRGQTVQQASALLERAGLRLGQVSYTFDDQAASGVIIYQFQAPGAQLAANGGVDVLVSRGAPIFQFGPGPPGRQGPKPPGQEHGG